MQPHTNHSSCLSDEAASKKVRNDDALSMGQDSVDNGDRLFPRPRNTSALSEGDHNSVRDDDEEKEEDGTVSCQDLIAATDELFIQEEHHSLGGDSHGDNFRLQPRNDNCWR